MNQFGRFIWDARGRKGWDFCELARALGADTPRQLRRMRGALASFEQADQTDLDDFRRIVEVLEVPSAEVEALIARVEEEEAVALEKWLSVPQPMRMHFRALPGFYCSKVLRDMTREEAEAYVSRLSRGLFGPCALEVSRRLTIWYQAGTGLELRRVVRGRIGEEGPCAVLAGTRHGFTFVSDGGEGAVRE